MFKNFYGERDRSSTIHTLVRPRRASSTSDEDSPRGSRHRSRTNSLHQEPEVDIHHSGDGTESSPLPSSFFSKKLKEGTVRI